MSAIPLLGQTVSAADPQPDYLVKITGAVDTSVQANGSDSYKVDFQVQTANGCKIANAQSLKLSIDLNVFKLARYDGTSADSIMNALTSNTVAPLPAYTVYALDGWQGSMLAIKSADDQRLLLAIEPSRGVDAFDYPDGYDFPVSTILESFRLAFQDGKSIDDMTADSIRLMNEEELLASHQNEQIVLNNGVKDVYVWGSQDGRDTPDTQPPAMIIDYANAEVTTTEAETSTEAVTTTAAETTTTKTVTTKATTTAAVETTTEESTTTAPSTTKPSEPVTTSVTSTITTTVVEPTTTTVTTEPTATTEPTTKAATTTEPTVPTEPTTKAATTTEPTTPTEPTTNATTTTAAPIPPGNIVVGLASRGFNTHPAAPPTAGFTQASAPTVTQAPVPPTNEPKTIIFTIGSLTYTVNGASAQFDVAPYIDSTASRTMVPIRFIAEAFGASVNWDESNMTDTIYLDGKTLTITVDQPLPNGMGTAALVNSRLFVPVRYVSEQLGASVDWNASTNTVTIVK